MILTSQSVVLTGAGGINGDNPVFGIDNLVTLTSVSSLFGSDPLFPVSNLVNPQTTQYWKATSTAPQYLDVKFDDGATTVDYLAIAKHNLGTNAVPIYVQVATTLVAGVLGGWVFMMPAYIPADNAPLVLRFPPTVCYGARLTMSSGSVIPKVSVLYVGRLVIAPSRIYVGHTPITMGTISKDISARSEVGNFLGRIILGEAQETTIDLQNLPPGWYRSTMDPLIKASKERPFFFAWRPQSYPLEVGFVWTTGDPRPTNQRSNGMMQISIGIRGIAS